MILSHSRHSLRRSFGAILLGLCVLTVPAGAQPTTAEVTVKEAPQGEAAAAGARRNVEVTINTPAGAPRPDEARQVYILRPGSRDPKRLFELEKTVVEMGLVRRSRVDTASGSLVVLCTPAELPEVERVVKSLSAETAGGPPSGAPLRQLALDVKVVLASTAPASDRTGGLGPALARRLTGLFG